MSCRRVAVLEAAPCTPLPFSTSTETRSCARSGCEGSDAMCRTLATTCRVGFATAAAFACTRCGASCAAPIAISATSSTIAIAPTTTVDVRQGKEVGSCSACCTEHIDSPPARRFLLRGDPPPRLREPVVERASWAPTELALGVRDVEDAPLELADPRGRELGRASAAGH